IVGRGRRGARHDEHPEHPEQYGEQSGRGRAAGGGERFLEHAPMLRGRERQGRGGDTACADPPLLPHALSWSPCPLHSLLTSRCREIIEQVRTGELTPGDKLPAIRTHAADLGLAAGTVARAYKLL